MKAYFSEFLQEQCTSNNLNQYFSIWQATKHITAFLAVLTLEILIMVISITSFCSLLMDLNKERLHYYTSV